MVEVEQLSCLLRDESSPVAMGNCRFSIVPVDEGIQLFEFSRPVSDPSPGGSPEGVLNKAKSLVPQLGDLVQVAIWVEYHIQVVALTSNMNLVVPKQQRHERYLILIRVMPQDRLSKRVMLMLGVGRLIPNQLRKIPPQRQMLVQLVGQLLHRSIHHPDIVDGVLLHAAHDPHEVHSSQ